MNDKRKPFPKIKLNPKVPVYPVSDGVQEMFVEHTGKVSDGYHTFDELYEHRHRLFISLAKVLQKTLNDVGMVWRSRKHSDGTEMDGWFIMGINIAQGDQITYHLPIEKWSETEFCTTMDFAPKYDGHTSNDVLERIKNLVPEPHKSEEPEGITKRELE